MLFLTPPYSDKAGLPAAAADHSEPPCFIQFDRARGSLLTSSTDNNDYRIYSSPLNFCRRMPWRRLLAGVCSAANAKILTSCCQADLRRRQVPLSESTIDTIKHGIGKYGVLVFRKTDLDDVSVPKTMASRPRRC